MQCSICQFANPEGARFCSQCGTFLYTNPHTEIPTQSFDEKLAKIQRYLPQGLTQKILSQRDRIEGERRHVTVMFCDMEGFTPLVDRLGAEAIYTIMGQIYEILIEQVHDYEGTINEMTGDGIMALFGAPIALEEAPQRAIWAAHSIHREIAVFNRKREGLGPIRMRIGIHSGPVVVGTLGNDLRVEFKAVGNTVNLASRMECLAEPGTTYVTREVYNQTHGMFEFEDLGKRVIKGKGESIQVYKVLPGRKDIHRPRLGSERMIFSEMVGRKSKLNKLELQVGKLINGAGSIVNITGEAGIGKSRLLAELKRREIVKRVLFLEGRAISMGRNLSFHPIIDLLKNWAGVRVDDGEAEAFTKLDIAIRELFQEQTGKILPFVATLMGMNLPPPYRERLRGIEGEALEKLVRKSMRDLFTRLSTSRPLVVVIDDLHWFDQSSLELLKSLFRLAAEERILFINLFRTGYEETGQQILKAHQENPALVKVDIVLDPLDELKSETLIANMLNLQGSHHPVVGQIVERTGGNPYFIEEVVRSFIDEGAVIMRGGKFEVTSKFSQVTIPNTINDVLMARIDRLEEETRHLLKVAAVIGRSFFYRVLSEVAKNVRNMDERLSYLKEAQLIRERVRLEELEYLFKHALTQEAAYASILPEKCKALHMEVAGIIEKVFAKKLNAFYGMLAYHYSRAENLEKTEEALIKAGEEALKTSASSEALNYYMEALRLYQRTSGGEADPGKVALLEKNIALAFYNRGQYEEAVEYFDRALDYYWGKSPKHRVSGMLYFVYDFLHFLVALYLPFIKFKKVPTEKDCEVIELYYLKCQALIIIKPKRFFMESFYFYKRFTQFDYTKFQNGVGKFISASALFAFTGISTKLGRRILNLARGRLDEGDERLMITHDLLQTTLKYFAGNWKDIDPHDDDLVNRNLDHGEIWAASLHYHWHGFHNLYKGDLAKAHWIVGRLQNISEVYENDFSQLLEKLLNACLLVEDRRLRDALVAVDASIKFSKKTNAGLALIHLFGCKAQIYTLMGDFDAAEEMIAQASKLRRELDIVPWQLSVFLKSQTMLNLHRLQEDIHNGTRTDASKYRDLALKACRALLRQTRKVAQHRTEAYRMMGEYFWMTHKPKTAFKWWRKSVREGERLGARMELARTYFAIGKRLLENGSSFTALDGIEAPIYLEKARVLFVEIGLDWDLERLSHLPPN